MTEDPANRFPLRPILLFRSDAVSALGMACGLVSVSVLEWGVESVLVWGEEKVLGWDEELAASLVFALDSSLVVVLGWTWGEVSVLALVVRYPLLEMVPV